MLLRNAFDLIYHQRRKNRFAPPACPFKECRVYSRFVFSAACFNVPSDCGDMGNQLCAQRWVKKLWPTMRAHLSHRGESEWVVSKLLQMEPGFSVITSQLAAVYWVCRRQSMLAGVWEVPVPTVQDRTDCYDPDIRTIPPHYNHARYLNPHLPLTPCQGETGYLKNIDFQTVFLFP